MSADLEPIVRQVARDYLGAERPGRLEEFDAVFESAFEASLEGRSERSEEGRSKSQEERRTPGEGSGGGLPFDSSLLEPSSVAFVILVTVQLAQSLLIHRGAAERRRQLAEVKAALRAQAGDKRGVATAIDHLESRLLDALARKEPSTGARRGGLAAAELPTVASLQLLVQRRTEGGLPVLDFRLAGPGVTKGYLFKPMGSRVLDREPVAYLQEFLAKVARLATKTEEEQEVAQLWVGARGADLFRIVLPERLQEELRGLRGLARELLVVTEEPWIPWEVLKFPASDGESDAPFLCEEFVLSRWLSDGDPQRHLPLRRLALVLSESSRAEGGAEEARWLLGQAEAGGRMVDQVPARYRDVIGAMERGRYDGWHFIGHGGNSKAGPEWWPIQLDDRVLTPQDLSDRAARLGATHPLVFLNACRTGGVAPGLVGLEGWAVRFLTVGAGAFLGPLWSVRSSRAAAFACAFYRRFLDGTPIGEAFREARLDLRRRYPGDPTWLAYALYADPQATCGEPERTAAGEPAAVPSSQRPRAPSQEPPAEPAGKARKKAWTDKKEHKILAQRLSTAPPIAYEALVLRLLRPALGAWDRGLLSLGAGLVGTGSEPPYPVVAKILQFDAPGEALGPEEARHCEKAIGELRRGRIQAGTFLLVHNRHAGSAEFREAVLPMLRELEAAGTVARAELWDYQRLLRRAFNGMLDRVVLEARRRSLSLSTVTEVLGGSAWRDEPLERVPVRTSVLVADQHRLVREEDPKECVADPAELVLAGEERSVTLLLGAFGFGKTTALARALLGRSREVFFVPAARISGTVRGTKDLLAECLDLDRLLAGAAEEEIADYRLLARPVVEYVFKQKAIDGVLVLDGLDESPFLARPGAFQNLVNNLWDVRVPVILSMRTEFWEARRQDFEASIGELAGHGERRVRRIRAIELRSWGPAEIDTFLARYGEAIADGEGRQRLADLHSWLKDGRFETIYGGIPRRPLFLRLIADTVADQGLPGRQVGRARLLTDAARIKVWRDVVAPQRAGGVGRPSILGRPLSVTESVAIAWRAMVGAAAAMAREAEEGLELLSECRFDDVRAATPEIREVTDPLGLLLHSLLRLTAPASGLQSARVRFAHRAFQEFFLAWHLVETGLWRSARVPSSVAAWVDDLRSEKLVAEEGPPGSSAR